MDMDAYLKTVDEQMKAGRQKEERLRTTQGERRQQQVPVAVDRRIQPDRRSSKRSKA